MQSVSHFKQALRFLETLSPGLVLQLLWDVESTQTSFRDAAPSGKACLGFRLCGGVCAGVFWFPGGVGKPGGEGIFTQRGWLSSWQFAGAVWDTLLGFWE